MKATTERPPIVRYLPYIRRDNNEEYRHALMRIKNRGEDYIPAFHDQELRKYHSNVMRFEMSHGFPLITEREITEKVFRYAIAEIIGFIHGAVTLSELESFGLPKFWWKRWTEVEHVTTKKGEPKFNLPQNNIGEHLGMASYGGVWGHFPMPDGTTINQWERVIMMMIRTPGALTHRIVNWYPPTTIVPDGKRQVVVAPCHGDVQVTLNEADRTLVLDHIQRSADMPTGVPYNMIHYPAIGMMLAHVLGYTFTHYNHVMVNSHVYKEQWPQVDELLAREARALPTVTLDFPLSGDPVTDFFAIRPQHFNVSDYHPHKAMRINTSI